MKENKYTRKKEFTIYLEFAYNKELWKKDLKWSDTKTLQTPNPKSPLLKKSKAS